ncbi:sigma-70 family RNA polymerase sigma factor [Roseateles sp. DJS-2-20]|uniref:Sigma-70 family RNA polymerase sigma factor n=1 Tax=Roseateles paludis TaxID=3145238 RepID=A0ABV0G1T9_9BURK
MFSWPSSKRRPMPGAAAPMGGSAASVASAAGPAAEALELALLDGVRAGRRREFDELYRLYHPRLWRFLQPMLKQPELVEEALNDTLMVVWQRAASFDGRSKLSTWIFGIAYRRGLKALARLDLPVEPDPADDPADDRPGPEAELALAQLQASTREALASLSPEHRAVVVLCYFHDMAYDDIAAIVGCPPATVKTRMFYARRRLRDLLSTESSRHPGPGDLP